MSVHALFKMDANRSVFDAKTVPYSMQKNCNFYNVTNFCNVTKAFTHAHTQAPFILPTIFVYATF